MRTQNPDLGPAVRAGLLLLAAVSTAATPAKAVSPAVILGAGGLYTTLTWIVGSSSSSPWTRVVIGYLDIVVACVLMGLASTLGSASVLMGLASTLGSASVPSCCGLVALSSIGRNSQLGAAAGALGALGYLAAADASVRSAAPHTSHVDVVLKSMPAALGILMFGQLGRVNLIRPRQLEDASDSSADDGSDERILEDAISKSRGLAQEKEQKELELYDKSRKLETLIRVSHRMTTARHPDEVLGLVTYKAKDELNTTLAFALMLDGDVLRPAVRAGNFHDHTVRALHTQIGVGLLGQALQGDTGLRLCGTDQRLLDSPLGSTPDRIRTLMVVPLKGPQDKMPFGLLGVANLLVGSEFKDADEDYLGLLATDASIAIKNIWLYEGLRRSYNEMIHALAQAIEAKDPYTHGHVGRVQETSVRVARSMKLNDEEIEIIAKAAILHDVGKISTPNEILNKPGALTPVERRKMDDHVTSSIHILKDIDSLPDEVFEMVLYHHERFDGRGYPYGLRGAEIPIGAQIISVADAFDAMTSDRPYRKGFPIEKALDLLRQSAGSQFNDRVVHALLELHKPSRGLPGQLELARDRA
jgi:HD-GYP domain-containing protein (c-di-GMP phosphodiesterase class II)